MYSNSFTPFQTPYHGWLLKCHSYYQGWDYWHCVVYPMKINTLNVAWQTSFSTKIQGVHFYVVCLYLLEGVEVDKVRTNQNAIFSRTELHFTNNTNQFLNLRFSFSRIILIFVNKTAIYMFPSGPFIGYLK